jgi:hypothetical protein
MPADGFAERAGFGTSVASGPFVWSGECARGLGMMRGKRVVPGLAIGQPSGSRQPP